MCGRNESGANGLASAESPESVDRVGGKSPRPRSRSPLMASSSTSNPDLSKNLGSLSLAEQIDPWSHPIDDTDPEDPTVAAKLPTTTSRGGNVDGAPVGPGEPPPLPAATLPFESSGPKVQVDQAVLDEFDPLGNKVEQEAKKAWEQSEPHPQVQSEPPTQDGPTPPLIGIRSLPPPAPIPVPDPVPAPPVQTIADKPLPDPNPTTSTSTAQDLAQSISRSSTPSLSGLAAIARTFMPKSPVRASRPLSIDQATLLLSPTTAAFGTHAQEQGVGHRRSQSQGPASSSLNPEAQSKRDENRPQTPGSAPRTPKSAAKDVDKDQPPPFDFQSFLEQMKSKAAEPVAKYLRSCAFNIVKSMSNH